MVVLVVYLKVTWVYMLYSSAKYLNLAIYIFSHRVLRCICGICNRWIDIYIYIYGAHC